MKKTIVILLLILSACSTERKIISDHNQEKESKMIEYAGDEIVNIFLNDISSKTDIEIKNVKKGNVRTKYYAYLDDVYVEMLNAVEEEANYFKIVINQTSGKNSIDEITALFRKVLPVLDASITETEIDEYITEYVYPEETKRVLDFREGLTVRFYPRVFDYSTFRYEITTNCYNELIAE